MSRGRAARSRGGIADVQDLVDLAQDFLPRRLFPKLKLDIVLPVDLQRHAMEGGSDPGRHSRALDILGLEAVLFGQLISTDAH